MLSYLNINSWGRIQTIFYIPTSSNLENLDTSIQQCINNYVLTCGKVWTSYFESICIQIVKMLC